MFETIWTCTQEWSLIWSRTTAFTFDDVPPRLDLRIGVDLLEHPAKLAVPARRDADMHRLDRLGRREARLGRRCPPAGPRRPRPTREPSGELRTFGVRAALRDLGRPVAVQLRVRPGLDDELVVRSRLDDATVIEHDDEICPADGREAVGDDEGGAAREQTP